MTGLLLVLSLGLIWWLSGAALALAVPALTRLLRRRSPILRLRLWTSMALAPMLISLLANLILFAPNAWLWPVSTHCHGLECGIHLPSEVQARGILLITALALLIIGVAAQRLRWVRHCHHQQAVELGLLSAEDTDASYRRINDARPLAFTAGVRRAQIYLSSGLLERCDERTVEAVLAHERAHLERHDNLRRNLTMLLAPNVLAGPGRALQGQLMQAIELCADAHASQALNDPLQLAEALLAVARLQPATTPASTSSFVTGRGLEERVQALTQPQPPSFWSADLLAIGLALSVVCVLILVSVELGHHGLEWLLQHAPM